MQKTILMKLFQVSCSQQFCTVVVHHTDQYTHHVHAAFRCADAHIVCPSSRLPTSQLELLPCMKEAGCLACDICSLLASDGLSNCSESCGAAAELPGFAWLHCSCNAVQQRLAAQQFTDAVLDNDASQCHHCDTLLTLYTSASHCMPAH